MKSKLLTLFLFILVQTSLLGQINWQPLISPEGNAIKDFVIDQTGDIHVYREVEPYVMKSGDSGLTWEATVADFSDSQIFRKFYKAKDGSLYLLMISELFYWNGNSWDKQPFPQGIRVAANISKLPNNQILIVGLGSSHLSDNTGDNYSLLHEEDIESAVLATPGGDNNFLVLSTRTEGLLFKINDDGDDFRSISPSISIEDVESVWASESGTVLMTSDRKLLRSEDGGQIWDEVELIPGVNSQPLVVEIKEGNPNQLFAISKIGIFSSNDEGKTWSSFANYGDLASFYDLIEIHVNPNNEFFASRGEGCLGIYKLEDDKQSWTEVPINFKSPNISKIHKNDFSNIIYVSTCFGLIQYSEDNGLSWNRLNSPLPTATRIIHKLESTNTEFIFYFIGGSIFRSKDNGDTWEDVSFSGQGSWSPSYNPFNNTLYAYSSLNPTGFYSTDYGDSWNPLLLPNVRLQSEFKFSPDGSVYYISSAFNNSEIFRQRDINSTPEEIVLPGVTSLNPSQLGLLSDGNIIYHGEIIENGNIVKGFTIFNPNTNQIVSTQASNIPFSYVSSHDDLISSWIGTFDLSRDFGASWESNFLGLPEGERMTVIYEDNEGYLYSSGYFTGLYRSQRPVFPKKQLNIHCYRDENSDCQLNASDQILERIEVQAKNGASKRFSLSNELGVSNFNLPFGKYDITPEVNPNLWESCLTHENIEVNADSPTDPINILLRPKTSCADLQVTATFGLLRRCFDNNRMTIRVCNEGTATSTNGTLSFELDSFLIIINHDFPNLAQDPGTNNYTVQLDDLEALECQRFRLTLEIDCESELGQIHCIEVLADADNQCGAVKPYKLCEENIGSYDPNDKAAFINGESENGFVEPNQPIEYLIRFQNTGTDTAFTVRIEDQLSQFLNPSTVEIIDFSHPMNYELTDGGSLIFHFENIMLPDSNINEPLSHGFVKFMIDQETDVERGNYILNKAGIFFDFNDPVITNEVALRVGNYVSTKEIGASNYLHVYPNPTNTDFSIQLEKEVSGQLTIEVFDIFGKAVFEDTFRGKNYRAEEADLTQGTYLVRISGKDMKPLTRKLVKM